MKNSINENKELCEKYPFLMIRNQEGNIDKNYDYSYTWLDEIPSGWKKLFLQMCEDIRNELIKYNCLNDYYFLEVKEKYGSLTVYDNDTPSEEINEILDKYSYLSNYICIDCGSTNAILYTAGWWEPYCDKCFKVHFPNFTEKEKKSCIGVGKRSNQLIIKRFLKDKIEDIPLNVSYEWDRLNK